VDRRAVGSGDSLGTDAFDDIQSRQVGVPMAQRVEDAESPTMPLSFCKGPPRFTSPWHSSRTSANLPDLHAGEPPMMLIDEVLPRYDFRELHATTVRAPSNVILDCVVRQRAQDDPIVRLAIQLRELPSRVLGRSRRRPLDLEDFTFLGRDGDRSLAFGLTGAFWQADYGLLDIRTAETFKSNDRVDVCRLVMGFTAEATSSGETLLSTETRVLCPTPAMRRKFAPYWYVIRPVSGLIRRRMLGRIRQQAEGLASQ
jgi:hypothetical protein